MKPLKERISITIDGNLLERMREQADIYERSLSQMINIVLRDYLESDDNNERIKILLQGK